LKAQYHQARGAAANGDHNQARVALATLDTADTPKTLRALVKNDIAALAAVGGDRVAAAIGFRAALALDPECAPARAHLRALGGETREAISSPVPLDRPTRAVRVAVVSLLFNWPSTGGGNVHSAELTKFLAAAGYDVRHFYARFEPWGLGRVTERTPYPAEAIA